MAKLFGIGVLVLIGLVLFAVFGSALPDTNPLHGLAAGISQMGEAIMTSVAGVGRGVSGSFGG
jgi:hypothetical protein